MASKESIKSPSSQRQKAQALEEDLIMWEDAIDQGRRKILEECEEQPTIDKKQHPIEEQLSDQDFFEDLRTNTRCKDKWNDLCKAESGTQLANVAHSSSTKLASQHPRDLGERMAARVIKWAVKYYQKEGRMPETHGQKKTRKLEEEVESLKAENKQLRRELKLKDRTREDSDGQAVDDEGAELAALEMQNQSLVDEDEEDLDVFDQPDRPLTPPPEDDH